MRVLSIAAVVLLLSGCATRDDFLSTCQGNWACADSLAERHNGEIAAAVALGVLAVGAVAVVAASGSGGHSHGYGRGYHAQGCGSRGGPGWRHPNGRCASWQD